MCDICEHLFFEFNFLLEIVDVFDCRYISDTSYDYSPLEKISVFLNRNRKIFKSFCICFPSLKPPSQMKRLYVTVFHNRSKVQEGILRVDGITLFFICLFFVCFSFRFNIFFNTYFFFRNLRFLAIFATLKHRR